MSGAGRHHRLQSRASYCVLGCGEIVASRRGQPFDQMAVAGVLSGSRRGFALQDLRGVLGDGVTFVRSDPDEPTTLAYIEAQLGGGAYVIAQVFVAELVKSMRRQGTAVDEPHGPLGGTLHCVVLVEAALSSGEVLYLDPFFGRLHGAARHVGRAAPGGAGLAPERSPKASRCASCGPSSPPPFRAIC